MSDTIGKFFRNPVAKPGKQLVPTLTLPTTSSFQAPPTLSTPTPPPAMPHPVLSAPKPQPDQTAVFQETAPAIIPFEAPPKLSTPSAPSLQSPPVLAAPAVIPLEPAPVLSVPTVIPLEPAPVLSVPAVIPLEPAPALASPAVIPFEPAPPLTIPAVIPFEPAPPAVTPPAVPLEPAPPLATPQPVPFEPPPALTVPAVIPFEPPPAQTPPATVLFEPPPALTAPAPIDPGPPSTPNPPYYSDSNIVNAVGGIGVNLPDPLGSIGSPISLNIGLNPHSGLPMVKLDIHLKEIPDQIKANVISYAKAQANAIAQRGLTMATTAVNQALDRAKDAAVNAALDNITVGGVSLSEIRSGGRSLKQEAQSAPGGNLINLPQPDPGKQPKPHNDPTATIVEPFPIDPYDPDFTYVRDSREATQTVQENAAAALDKSVNSLNSWNDNSDYSSQMEEAQPKGLQRSFAVSAGGTNSQSGLINSPNGADKKGYFPFNGSEQSLPQDDAVYVPLVFTDLRPDYRSNLRAVYFRPFIKSLSENFAPQWNLANYFGRVDPVATYKSTNRTVSLGFKLTCFSPEDLAANYRKLAWLSSMCYPEYEGGAYFAGPVVRLRVGDVISSIGGATGKGLSGIITSLDISYDDATWELTANQKLPRDIDVSVGFQVLHDRAIGITRTNAGMQFGGYANGTSDIRKFRAAFGSVDYVNDTPALPQTGQIPFIAPLSANPLAGAVSSVPAVSNLTDGKQPSTQNLTNAAAFLSSNADGGLTA